MEQCKEEVRFRGNIHDRQLGANGTARNAVRKKQDIHEKVENPRPTHCFLCGKELDAVVKLVWPSLSW